MHRFHVEFYLTWCPCFVRAEFTTEILNVKVHAFHVFFKRTLVDGIIFAILTFEISYFMSALDVITQI